MPPAPNQESAKPADAAKPANVDWKIGWEALKGSAAAIAAVFSLYATHYSSRNTETLFYCAQRVLLRQLMPSPGRVYPDLVGERLWRR